MPTPPKLTVEANIEQGMTAVTKAHRLAAKPRQSKLKEFTACTELDGAVEELLGNLITYDALVPPNSPLMGKAIDTLKSHEPPEICKKFTKPIRQQAHLKT